MECERASLTAAARGLLEAVLNSVPADQDWVTVSVTQSGLTEYRLDEALAELESRQLVFVDRAPRRAFVSPDSRSRNRLERLIHQLETRREVERAKLRSMVGYATASTCRRLFILNYFGDRSEKFSACGGCDICNPD
jgi:ATP-dependent DNA helicase RecQ